MASIYPLNREVHGPAFQGQESPEDCILRELDEEFGLSLPAERLEYRKRYESVSAGSYAYVFVATLSARELVSIWFGSEGKRWRMMDIDEYLDHPEALANHKAWLNEYRD